MRGDDVICGSLFSYIDLEKRVSAAHPLRVLRQIANAALKSLSGAFAPLYSPIGRVSIPPERQLVDRLDHDLLFRWFVGLGIEDAVWDATTFTKNRDRLLEGEMAGEFSPWCCRTTRSRGCCRAIISQSTGHYWRRGRA